jgi:hypothetical protein
MVAQLGSAGGLLMVGWARRVSHWILPVAIVAEIGLVASGVLDLKHGLLAAVVVEGSLGGLVLIELGVAIGAVRQARAEGLDMSAALEEGLRRLLPVLVARLVRHDVMLVRALLLAVRRRPDVSAGEMAVRYGQEIRMLLWVVLIVDGGVAAILHLVIPWPWPWLRIVSLIAGIAGAVWLACFLATFYVYTHAIGPSRLRLRFAAMQDVSVPLNRVRAVRTERRMWATQKSLDVVDGTLTLPHSRTTNVRVDLHTPFEVERRGHPPAAVQRIAFAADDPAGAQRLIEALLPGHAGST